jgi:hypothetical protein
MLSTSLLHSKQSSRKVAKSEQLKPTTKFNKASLEPYSTASEFSGTLTALSKLTQKTQRVLSTSETRSSTMVRRTSVSSSTMMTTQTTSLWYTSCLPLPRISLLTNQPLFNTLTQPQLALLTAILTETGVVPLFPILEALNTLGSREIWVVQSLFIS